MDIAGPHDVIRSAVVGAALSASPILYEQLQFRIVDTGEGFSQLIVDLPPEDVRAFLRKADAIRFTARVKRPYTDIGANTFVAKSRNALLFVAKNCLTNGDT
jgi:hypothetical protein